MKPTNPYLHEVGCKGGILPKICLEGVTTEESRVNKESTSGEQNKGSHVRCLKEFWPLQGQSPCSS